MKAILYRSYGSPDVLQFEEIEKPAPGDKEALIKVRAASVNPYDWHFMRGTPYFLRMLVGLRKPRDQRLGLDVAGVVEAVGRNVTQLRPGEEVFGAGRGAFAEYVCASESKLTLKPRNVTFEQAASIPIAGLTAFEGLRRGGLNENARTSSTQKVLINGAAGGVGTFAVQIAKSFGAEVTGVCNTRNMEMLRSIGADHVIDYTEEDFTKSGQRYDLILDCIANHSLPAFRRVLSSKGSYIMVGAADGGGRWMIGLLVRLLKTVVLSWLGSQKLVMFGTKITNQDLTMLAGLMNTGQITPVIDRRYSLRELPEAVRYLEQGHARGKVVITL
ncbi:MAG TPA: NAD(P)-dependent alcohol dehydrogenase [Candidatus Dormibacteraeota bacterium]|nr:NAD(P)-dependent alcohol dehydrogenase [Candidatus Dormibacteraeota bacterium]